MVTFDAVKKRVILKPSKDPELRDDMAELLEGMKVVLARSGRRKNSSDEREKIQKVFEVLVS
jgi:hypothetical protein